MTTKLPKPWEIQPGETVKAFAAWTEYRDLPEHSAREVARRLKVNRNVVQRWCVRWRWVERLRAWVGHLDEVNRRDVENEIHDMNRRHANLSKAMLALVARQLNELGQDKKGHRVLKPNDIGNWVTGATKVERLARGQATEQVAPPDPAAAAQAHNLDALSTEELETLDHIYAAAAARNPPR